MQASSNGNLLAQESVLAKEMLGLLESAITALLANGDEKRLLEISRKLIEAQQKGEVSNVTYNYVSGIINTQWANRRIQPILEKFYKKSTQSLMRRLV
jgi:hypothetical protein